MLKDKINKTIAKVYNKANPYFQFGEGVLDNAERRDGRGISSKAETSRRERGNSTEGVREDNWEETIGRSFGVQDPNIFVRSVDSYFRGPLESVKEGTDEARACSRTREALTRCASSRKEFGDFVKYTAEASFEIAPDHMRKQGIPYYYDPDDKIIYMNPDVINKLSDDKLVETLVLHEFIHDATNIGLSRHAINVVMEDSRGLGQELNDHIQENGTEEQNIERKMKKCLFLICSNQVHRGQQLILLVTLFMW